MLTQLLEPCFFRDRRGIGSETRRVLERRRFRRTRHAEVRRGHCHGRPIRHGLRSFSRATLLLARPQYARAETGEHVHVPFLAMAQDLLGERETGTHHSKDVSVYNNSSAAIHVPVLAVAHDPLGEREAETHRSNHLSVSSS